MDTKNVHWYTVTWHSDDDDGDDHDDDHEDDHDDDHDDDRNDDEHDDTLLNVTSRNS